MAPSPDSRESRRKSSERPGSLLHRFADEERAVTSLPSERRHALVLKPDTQPRSILALARHSRSEPELLEGIALSRRWIVHYDIVQALCFNARTPLRAALPLLQRLYPIDLTKLLSQVRLVPGLRNAAAHLLKTRLEGLSAGERLGLAKNARGPAAGFLLALESDGRILTALLDNPGLRELEVLQRVSNARTPPETLAKIGRHARWSRSARVRSLLAQNPATPPDVVLALLESLHQQELGPVASDERLDPVVRLVARRYLEEKQRRGPFAPPQPSPLTEPQ
jgi:hypothetical protein